MHNVTRWTFLYITLQLYIFLCEYVSKLDTDLDDVKHYVVSEQKADGLGQKLLEIKDDVLKLQSHV